MTPFESVRRAVDDGGEPDDVLRSVVAALVDVGGARWAGIFFVEEGELVLGPEAGVEAPDTRASVPVVYGGTAVAELAADACDRDLLDQVAPLIAEHCLVGWDTGGVPWDEAP